MTSRKIANVPKISLFTPAIRFYTIIFSTGKIECDVIILVFPLTRELEELHTYRIVLRNYYTAARVNLNMAGLENYLICIGVF